LCKQDNQFLKSNLPKLAQNTVRCQSIWLWQRWRSRRFLLVTTL
jgi:hypothetical protein